MRTRIGAERSSESLTIRIKPSIKARLKKSAEDEKMGMAEFIEIMILDYCSEFEENEEKKRDEK